MKVKKYHVSDKIEGATKKKSKSSNGTDRKERAEGSVWDVPKSDVNSVMEWESYTIEMVFGNMEHPRHVSCVLLL